MKNPNESNPYWSNIVIHKRYNMNIKTNRNSVQPTVRNLRKDILPLLLVVVGLLAGSSEGWATLYATYDFSSGYTNGNLVGQNSWTQVGTGSTGPIQVTNSLVRLKQSTTNAVTGGVQNAFQVIPSLPVSGVITNTSYYYVLENLNVISAYINSGGTSGAGIATLCTNSTASGSFARLYLKRTATNNTTNFVYGLQAGTNTSYGTNVYATGSTSKVVVTYDANPAGIDSSSLYINPVGTNRATWVPELTVNLGGTKPASFQSFSLQQGAQSTGTNQATMSRILIGDDPAEVLPAPAAPTVSGAVGISTSGFVANWSASTGATKYYLDVATDSGFTTFVSGFENLDVLTAVSKSVTGTFTPGQSVFYRVRASNSNGLSVNSATQEVLITSAPAVLVPTVTNSATSGTVTWTSGPDWIPNNPVSASNATVTFNGVLNGVLTANNDTASPFVLNSLVFANSGAGTNDITGGVLQLTNNGTTNPTITFANNSTYQRVSAPIQLDTNVTVSQSGSTASNSILAGVISGVGGLTKGGAGYVYLTQTNNNFGGPVTIGNGTLVPENIGLAGQNSSLGTNGAITLGGGGLTGTLRWGSGSVTNEATDKTFALAGSTGGGTIDVRGTNSLLTLNGAIDMGTNAALRTFTLTGEGGATVNGLISGTNSTSLRVNGSKSRTVILANAGNSFGGPVTIDGNIAGQSYRVQVASIGNAGLSSPLGTNNTINIGTTVGSFNFLVWSNTVAETTDKTINLAGTVGGALIANKGPALLKFTAPVTATGVGTKTFYADQDDANGVTEFAGEIPNSSGGTTALNKNGPGMLILSAANTFTGGFTLKGGTLELRNAQSFATGNILTVPTNATLFPRVKVAYAGAGSNLGNLLVQADVTIDLGTDNTAEIRFGSATGWTADKILSVAKSSGGGRLYILDTNNVNLSQIKSVENPAYEPSLAADGLLSFTAPAPTNTAPAITSGGAFSVPENSTGVTTVTATDAEGNALTYSISGGSDADKFWIDSGTGILTFVSAPNFESPIDVGADNVYNLTVQVADGVLAATKDIAVTVTNVSDSPTDFKADWLAANGLPSGSSWNSDPNNVGYSLATAYAFGLSPSVNSGAPVALASSPAGSVKIVYLQREDTSGVTYSVKSGTDLAAGLNGTVTPQVSANQPVPGKPGYTQYEASYSSGVDKGFLKVQAELP